MSALYTAKNIRDPLFVWIFFFTFWALLGATEHPRYTGFRGLSVRGITARSVPSHMELLLRCVVTPFHVFHPFLSNLPLAEVKDRYCCSGPKVLKKKSCSTKLSMNFFQLINVKVQQLLAF